MEIIHSITMITRKINKKNLHLCRFVFPFEECKQKVDKVHGSFSLERCKKKNVHH